MAAKRDSAGKRITPESSTSVLGLECLPLSPSQLREMWNFDNECGSQIMGAPLRTCKCEEDDTADGVSHAELENLKVTIKLMWEKAKTIFEIFIDPKQPDLGYRLKVKDNMPIKISVKSEDGFYLGWCAQVPESSRCSHLYRRSPVKPEGYMGGPASYANWAVGKQATANFTRPASRCARFLARLECKNLKSGTEILWNYGCGKEMPVPDGVWFLKCCRVSASNVKRQEKKQHFVSFLKIEKCVLCGKPFSINNKESRIQRKPHFINSHADYLGSCWNGLDKPYMQEVVDGLKVLLEADKLNSFCQTLSKDLRWQFTPACTIISTIDEEHYGENHDALLQEFKKRCSLLRASGTLVLRGMTVVCELDDLTMDHLKPIAPSVWRTLKWNDHGPPPTGLYAVPPSHNDEHTADVESAILKFCMDNFS